MKKTLKLILLFMAGLLMSISSSPLSAQSEGKLPPVWGLAIAAPEKARVDEFTLFMEEVLAPAGINTLVLRVDYRYTYKSHPELRARNPLGKAEVRSLVKTARQNGIRLIPQINLLGHQSWHTKMGPLLQVYPQFDENPSVKLPDEYEWPNPDGLYCKSYCPLHPDVHEVVFALMDELMDAFEADAFHAGLDEVFYIGEEECPRCSGKDKAELFAGEVNKIQQHLAERDAELWIWGDRLLEGSSTGLGMWEASENGTHKAIDMIPDDVIICDWHYERADATAAYFAMEGFSVVTCPWNRPAVTRDQLEMMELFRKNATPELRERFSGMMLTIWSPASSFIREYYETEGLEFPYKGEEGERSQAASFREMLNFYKD